MEDKLNKFLGLVKCKIQFTTPEGNYEGIVRLVCPVTKKIVLERLFFLPKNLYMGVLNFHLSEILSHKLINELTDEVQHKLFETNNSTTPVSKQFNCFEMNSSKNITLLPPSLSSVLPIDFSIIDCINTEFKQVISHISKQDAVGVSLGGASIGRNGLLSWLSISTSFCTFLLDMQQLKERAFQEGLKEIFENGKIEKILHDCRRASDCLHHQFDTKLINVFDTQVADLFVSLQSNKKGEKLQQVNSLNICLTKYLDISNEFLPSIQEGSYQDQIIIYRLRPLENDLKDTLIKRVIYLRPLKYILKTLMFNPFNRAVEIYLQVLQKATDKELLVKHSTKGIPHELALEGLQITTFKDNFISSIPEHHSIVNIKKDYVDLSKGYVTKCKSSTKETVVYSEQSDENSLANTLVCTEEEKHFKSKNKDIDKSGAFQTRNISETYSDGVQLNKMDKFMKRILQMKEKSKSKKCDNQSIKSYNLVSPTKKETRSFKDVSTIFIESVNVKQKDVLNSKEDSWAELREAFNVTQNSGKDKKINFIPAGMAQV